MPVLARLFRNTPGVCLKDYFDAKTIVLPEPVQWNGNNATILHPLLRAVNALSDREREIIRADAERVDRMASEVGQAAIMAVASAAQQAEQATDEFGQSCGVQKPRPQGRGRHGDEAGIGMEAGHRTGVTVESKNRPQFPIPSLSLYPVQIAAMDQ